MSKIVKPDLTYQWASAAGAVTLYVNDVAVNTATSVITEYLLDRSALLILVFAQIGYYDDLIIHRN